ncbi:AAA family ATPase [Erwinia sp. BC051422]|uniref:tyrosine-protein kinase family protein n=1 Tax=Erwinia wuhanensis TaxID=3045167 RepID=UPI002655B0C7|nr:AAA family ATPase [Erwinia sp. BC051422]MDN8542021.1 AAA family ATPase [Erwinia sp. BC051422]
MLKSVDFIKRLHNDLVENINKKTIKNFYIELRINQVVEVYIVSDDVKSIDEIYFSEIDINEFNNKKIELSFLSLKASKDDDHSHHFEGERISIGLRRSLTALLDMKNGNVLRRGNVVTFFSYKGGVGRTTSLALTATYLSRQGKKVFVIDCDFEAPGLINFFNTSQAAINKSGLVEYLNDKEYTQDCNIEDYIYNIEKNYSGSGVINMLPAGNILHNSEDLTSYLEGLAKIDLQSSKLTSVLNGLLDDINEKYSPDVILIDSRTGFNNIFGCLCQLSSTVVVLAGDDAQNQPGIEYVTKTLNENNVNSCFILSILSSNFSRRYNNFSNQIKGLSSFDAEVFYFDRQNTLEFIGTSLEDSDDLDDFISGENGSIQYQKFFKYIYDVTSYPTQSLKEKSALDNQTKEDDAPLLSDEEIEINETQNSIKSISLQDEILNNVKDKLPNLYAENIEYSDEYINRYFYFRPCMEDLFIPEKNILLGDKGTGKTAFYKALQIDSFFKMLTSKAQRAHLDYQVLNITNFEKDNFEFIGFDNYIKDELFIKRFWMFYIWNAICARGNYAGENKELLINLGNFGAQDKIINLINDPISYAKIEEELSDINNRLKSESKRLVITFDQLDNIVKPFLWNDVVSPLVKIAMRFAYDNIHPKLFLRRDLYERLGNLTNKSSFSARIINLEWSQDEIFSYFLKIVFNYSKDSFFKFLGNSLASPALISQIRRKLKTKDFEHNQLPLDKYLIQPVINVFFGDPRVKNNGRVSTAYEDLYRNIQSADKTVNLRPFIDLLTHAIKVQDEQDIEKKFRKNAVLGLAYCTSSQVRKSAVVNYLEDLWNEKGNEFVKYFCLDISNNQVNSDYKRNVLNEYSFDKLLEEVKTNHSEDETIRNGTLDEFKQVLIANKIITPYMVGSKTKYGFAYLYTNYLGM